jgi:hypothetical protein
VLRASERVSILTVLQPGPSAVLSGVSSSSVRYNNVISRTNADSARTRCRWRLRHRPHRSFDQQGSVRGMYFPLATPPKLTSGVKANKAKTGAAASPFVVAITLVGIKVGTPFPDRKPCF